MKKEKIIKIITILSFIIVILTSIPLFIKYLLGSSINSGLIVDLHVWMGIIFIIGVLIRMIFFKGKEI